MDDALAVGAGVNCARSCEEVRTKANARTATIPDRPTKPISILLLQSEFTSQVQVLPQYFAKHKKLIV
jgi:hypothetical protein